MKILITGGGGFLGFRLAQTLLERGSCGRRRQADRGTQITLLDGAFPPGVEICSK